MTASLEGRTVAVVGGGPGGLMAAEVLARGGVRVTVFDRMPSPGRKLLLAGRGGLNLTHSEPLEQLLSRYGPARAALEPAIRAFPPEALRAWCAALGQPTFVGSSGRVFPEAFRATPLVRSWLRRLTELGVEFRPRHTWTGWADDGALRFTDAAGATHHHRPDATVLALGGASWPRTGSDGRWVAAMAAGGIAVTPLRPANCGFEVAWSAPFAARFAGVPVKNVSATVVGSRPGVPVRGEAMITSYGIEGGVVYALGAAGRDTIEREGVAHLVLDLHPDLSEATLASRLGRRRAGDSFATHVKRAAGLPAVAVALLGERADRDPIDRPAEPAALARALKAVTIRLDAPRPIERAISTAGGVALDEVGADWMLVDRPGVVVVGEMLDWEAPTGGYLLQATFSTAVAGADHLLTWLASGGGHGVVGDLGGP